MLIDWFTIIAQVLNFLMLVWLMRRYLYQPILHAIDEREKRIAARLADAERKETDAQKEGDEYKRKNKDFEEERARLLAQATEVARKERERLLAEARKAAAELSLKQQEALRIQEQNAQQEIIRRIQKEVFALTRTTLKVLAGASFEESLVAVFVRKLKELNGAERTMLSSAFNSSTSPVIIRTSLPLPPAQSAAIEGAIREVLGAKAGIQFETTQDLIGGIELTTNGQKVAWSIASYMDSIEKGINDILKEKGSPARNGLTAAGDHIHELDNP